MSIAISMRSSLRGDVCGAERATIIGQQSARIPIVPSIGRDMRPQRTRRIAIEALGFNRAHRTIYRWVTRAQFPTAQLNALSNLGDGVLLFLGAFSISFAFARVNKRVFHVEQRLLGRCHHLSRELEQEYNTRLNHLNQRHRKDLEKLYDDMVEVNRVYADLEKMKAELKAHLSRIDHKR